MKDEKQDTMLSKIHRVTGQMNGIEQMYVDGRECLEIVNQIIAVRSALSSIAKDVLAGEASRCARTRKPEDFDRVLQTLMTLS